MTSGSLHQRNTQRLIVRIALGVMVVAGISVGVVNSLHSGQTTTTTTMTTPYATLAVRFGQAVTNRVTNVEPIYEFFGQASDGAKLSCELSLSVKWSTTSVAYCVSLQMSHVHSATLGSNGVTKLCDGDQCGSNAGINTPTLAVGTEIRSGSFTCLVLSDSVACETKHHQGFNFFVDRTDRFS